MINVIIYYNSSKDDPTPLTSRLDNNNIKYTLQDISAPIINTKVDQTVGVISYKAAIMEILTRIRSIT